MSRKPGFYWVRTSRRGGAWIVAEWDDVQMWSFPGDDCQFDGDGDWLLECIGPIEPPTK